MISSRCEPDKKIDSVSLCSQYITSLDSNGSEHSTENSNSADVSVPVVQNASQSLSSPYWNRDIVGSSITSKGVKGPSPHTSIFVQSENILYNLSRCAMQRHVLVSQDRSVDYKACAPGSWPPKDLTSRLLSKRLANQSRRLRRQLDTSQLAGKSTT